MRSFTIRVALVLGFAVLAATASPAAAAPNTTKTVDAQVIFEHGARADDPGNCSAIAFVQWKDVPGTISAKAIYTWRGSEYTKVAEPPFNDEYEWVIAYKAPAGTHRIQVGKGWSDGPVASDCSDHSAKQKEDFSVPAKVELTIENVGETEACAAALKKLRALNKTVRRLKGKLRKATGDKSALRAQLAGAQKKRAKAAARVRREC